MQRIDKGKPIAAAIASAKVVAQASQRPGFLRPPKHLVFAFRLIQNLWLLRCIISGLHAGIAQLVERNLAKVEVASSSLVSRSTFWWSFFLSEKALLLFWAR